MNHNILMKLLAALAFGILLVGCPEQPPQPPAPSPFKSCGPNGPECGKDSICLANDDITCPVCNLIEACDVSTVLSPGALFPLYGPQICEICRDSCDNGTPAANFCNFVFGGACFKRADNVYVCGGSCPVKGDKTKCTWPQNPPLYPADYRCGYQSSPILCCTIYGSVPNLPQCPNGTR